MPPSSLEGRIRELCAQAVTAEGQELQAILSELQTAIHDHVSYIRAIVLEQLPEAFGTRET